jgi:hypothetical protein
LVERIQKALIEETQKGADMAAAEWKHASHDDNLNPFSAAPLVTLLPEGSGFDIQVRYVTRASERADTRVALYKRLFDLLEDQSAPAGPDQHPGTAVA